MNDDKTPKPPNLTPPQVEAEAGGVTVKQGGREGPGDIVAPTARGAAAGRVLASDIKDALGGSQQASESLLKIEGVGLDGSALTLKNVVIGGDFELDGSSCGRRLSLSGCLFEGGVVFRGTFSQRLDLSSTTFARAACFEGAQFLGGLVLRAAHAKGDLKLACADFGEDSSFADLRVEGLFEADGARFLGAVSFARSHFSKSVSFAPRLCAGALRQAEFVGSCDFSDAEIEGPAYFDCAQFGGDALFRRARLRSAAYFRCLAEPLASDPDAKPDTAHVKRVRFGGKTDFSNAHIEGVACFNGAIFVGKLLFERVRAGSTADFNSYISEDKQIFTRTVFKQRVSFVGAAIVGGAAFMGAHFLGEAIFERLQVGGHLLFKALDRGGDVFKRVFFRKSVTFLAARVANNAEFDGAVFASWASFDRMEVGRSLFIRTFVAKGSPRVSRAVFKNDADFIGALVKGDAEFTGTHFMQRVRFESFHVEGTTYFNDKFEPFIDDAAMRRNVEPVRFGLKADFTGAHFGHRADFCNAKFENDAVFVSADFDGAASFEDVTFTGLADFKGCLFNQHVDFIRTDFLGQACFISVTINGGAFFTGAKFEGKTSFLASKFKSLAFHLRTDAPKPYFGGNLNLDGFTYELIDIHPPDVLDQLLASLRQYNRQPYTQLEKVLRSIGFDELADKTYLRQRERERQYVQSTLDSEPPEMGRLSRLGVRSGQFFDLLQKHVVNYGIRPFPRLLIISIAVLALGTVVFSSKGAVELKEKPDKSEAAKEAAKEEIDLSWTQAVGMSLHQFVPIGEVASGSKWRPSQKLLPAPFIDGYKSTVFSYAAYGTLHRVLGFILIPLGVAALTGVLHRKDRPGR